MCGLVGRCKTKNKIYILNLKIFLKDSLFFKTVEVKSMEIQRQQANIGLVNKVGLDILNIFFLFSSVISNDEWVYL